MKILLYGYNGWIGQQFVTTVGNDDTIEIIRGVSRADDMVAVRQEIYSQKPTHVLSMIGRTHGKTDDGTLFNTIDYLEQPGKLTENIRDNLFAPLLLALICKDYNIHFTYLGTGCIFSYLNDTDFDNNNTAFHGFTEDDIPNFKGSGYSTVKGYTDMLMHQFNTTVLNLRIRMPVVGYDHPRNFITKIRKYDKICSIPNSMTILSDMLPFTVRMMRECVVGTINLTNPGVISHNEVLSLYKQHVDTSFTWDNFSIQEQRHVIASERSNNLLNTSKLEHLFPGEVEHIQSAMKRIMTTYCKDTSMDRKKDRLLKELDTPGSTVFVTGGAGFIGSAFINHLHENTKHIKIINFDALYYCANHEQNVHNDVRNSKRYTFIHGNLKSLDLLRHIFKSVHITYIVHFAAQSHVQNSFSNPLQYTNDNVIGTHNLLETARTEIKTGVLRKFIHVSTDEVYGESLHGDNVSMKTEKSILCPSNPYAASKAAAELIASSYHHSFHMPIIITRGNNVYGPNQYPEKVIPKFIQLLNEHKPLTIQGDGSCVRAFLHVHDVASAFTKILECGSIGEIYNIGSDTDEYTILDIATRIIRHMKPDVNPQDWIVYTDDRPFNDKRYYIDNRKIKALGWSIHVPFEEGLRKLAVST